MPSVWFWFIQTYARTMKSTIKTLILSAMIGIAASSVQAKTTLNDAQIKQAIIKESIESYPGSCPCPYNTDRAGRSCGKRSAYSRAGGYDTICYQTDVTKEMIESWKKSQTNQASSKLL